MEISDVNTVFTPYGIHLIGNAVPDCGSIQITNVQVDNGNSGSQSVSYGLVADGVSDGNVTNLSGIFNAAGARMIMKLSNRSDWGIVGVRAAAGSSTNCVELINMDRVTIDTMNPSGFTYAVSLDSNCSDCYMGNVGGAVNDAGTNNRSQMFVSDTWDPANLSPGQQDFHNITMTGVKFGATCELGVPYDLQNMIAIAAVTSANNVRITLFNSSGGSVNLGSGTWTVRAINPGPT